MLRMSVPVILGQEPFPDFLSGFLKAQQRIRIDLFITNLFLDLVAENIDVAIRFGELEDSSVVFAVYSNRKFLPLRLNIFLNALAAWKSPLWIREWRDSGS
jgi:DNA-binding transcriptional LysR family regulator